MKRKYNPMLMEEALKEICTRLKRGEDLSPKQLDRILREQSRALDDPAHRLSKRKLLAFYLRESEQRSPLWESLGLDGAQEDELVRLLRAKPRRTASGVATVTVLTKPWPCANDCIYCPSDVTMPKSYIADEPACQRAARCSFDPYLQVGARLKTLARMGHNTDKVELIVLGGTWMDYPEAYRSWFMCGLFHALDDFGSARADDEMVRRLRAYEEARERSGAGCTLASRIDEACRQLQREVDAGRCTYREAFDELEALRKEAFPELSDAASLEELARLQEENERASARCVGLVIETRPETISVDALRELRAMGATKIQVGIQALDDEVLRLNGRPGSVRQMEHALGLMRLFGFKSHVHMMANLIGSAPSDDLAQYRMLMEDGRFMPDEVKLYPCALVASARLTEAFEAGRWAPYAEDELVDLLASCVLATPEHTRISRMIRDIPSDDILTGSKKTNLRQIVEERVRQRHGGADVREMRMREVATGEVDAESLALHVSFHDTANTREAFLQWVDGDGRLAGFLRLSLPDQGAIHDARAASDAFPIAPGAAMIREVHVYGRTAKLHESAEGNQHLGLGRELVERACAIAREEGFQAVNVISAVGTREYYRRLGFCDDGLYQRRELL